MKSIIIKLNVRGTTCIIITTVCAVVNYYTCYAFPSHIIFKVIHNLYTYINFEIGNTDQEKVIFSVYAKFIFFLNKGEMIIRNKVKKKTKKCSSNVLITKVF